MFFWSHKGQFHFSIPLIYDLIKAALGKLEWWLLLGIKPENLAMHDYPS